MALFATAPIGFDADFRSRCAARPETKQATNVATAQGRVFVDCFVQMFGADGSDALASRPAARGAERRLSRFAQTKTGSLRRPPTMTARERGAVFVRRVGALQGNLGFRRRRTPSARAHHEYLNLQSIDGSEEARLGSVVCADGETIDIDVFLYRRLEVFKSGILERFYSFFAVLKFKNLESIESRDK
jgi:hypothetical protein